MPEHRRPEHLHPSRGYLSQVELPLAGLMSLKPVSELALEMQTLNETARNLGVRARTPALAITGLALTVIPEVRICDLAGLMDVQTQEPLQAMGIAVDPTTGKQIARSTGTTKRRDAERKAANWERELRDGHDHRPRNITWEDFRQRYDRLGVFPFHLHVGNQVSPAQHRMSAFAEAF